MTYVGYDAPRTSFRYGLCMFSFAGYVCKLSREEARTGGRDSFRNSLYAAYYVLLPFIRYRSLFSSLTVSRDSRLPSHLSRRFEQVTRGKNVINFRLEN